MAAPLADRLMEIRALALDRDLHRQAIADQLIGLSATPRWRDVGGWQLTVPPGPAADVLVQPGAGAAIQVDGVTVMSGPMRQASWGPDGTLEVSGYDDLVWLAGRAALTATESPYPTFVDYDGPAETVIRALVDDNAGPGAAAERRAVVLEPDQGRGTTATWKATGQPLLDLIREIAVGQGWGLQVRWAAGVRTFTILVPRDVSTSVRLHESKGAIADWRRTVARPEASYVLASGPEAGGIREVAEGASDDAGQWGRIEQWVEDRQAINLGQLGTARDAALADHGAVDEVTAEIAPVGAFTFGTDYRLGDVISVEAGGMRRTDTVVGLDVTATTVTPVLSGGRVLPALPSLRRIAELERRTSRLETS